MRRIEILLLGPALLLLAVAGPMACCRVNRALGPETNRPRPEPEPPVGYAHFQVPKQAVPANATQTVMKNVDFHLDSSIILRIRELRGEMRDKNPGAPLNFDNKRSFIMKIFSAEIAMTGPSLADLMNHYLFAYPGAPLRDLSITTSGHQLRQEGVMHKVIDIPFAMLAEIRTTPEGRIRIHPTKIDICNLNGQALLKAFGLNLEKLLDLSKAKGVRVEANDLLLDPKAILPPPTIEGHLAGIRIEGDEIVQSWESDGSVSSLTPPFPDEPNYMYYREGTLRMGKIFMPEADMEVVDTDPSDPFDFFLDYYNNQLVAGFTENQPNYGLKVFMRDFEDLGNPLKPGERASAETAALVLQRERPVGPGR